MVLDKIMMIKLGITKEITKSRTVIDFINHVIPRIEKKYIFLSIYQVSSVLRISEIRILKRKTKQKLFPWINLLSDRRNGHWTMNKDRYNYKF